MKKQILSITFATVAATLTLLATPVIAQNQAAPALAYGTANVLKLAQAKVGEETIIAYIEKSGQSYNLGASEIIYLRDQGVTDRVLTTMLAQEKSTRDTAVAQATAQPTTVAPTPVAAPAAPVVVAPQYQQTYVPPPVTYVQAEPAPLIVMRDSSPRLADYGIYPRHYYNYGCYPNYGYRSYGYSYPRVSFSVGFGGHHGGFSGYYGGGFRGGYCR
jgi:hypothetical protein